MIYTLYAWPIITAILWRLGGGAFTTITNINLGTDPARGLRALSVAILFMVIPWWICLIAMLLMFAGICVAGWGPFQGMGTYKGPIERSWENWLPEKLGLTPNTVAYDYVGITLSGFLCMFPVSLLLAIVVDLHFYLLSIEALLFGPSYLLATKIKWSVPKFATGQEWGEVFVGLTWGIVLVAEVGS